MADRFTGALPPPEMTVHYATIPLCSVQPFLCLRFTVHSRQFTVHGSQFTENPITNPLGFVRRDTSPCSPRHRLRFPRSIDDIEAGCLVGAVLASGK